MCPKTGFTERHMIDNIGLVLPNLHAWLYCDWIHLVIFSPFSQNYFLFASLEQCSSSYRGYNLKRKNDLRGANVCLKENFSMLRIEFARNGINSFLQELISTEMESIKK